MRRLAAVVAAAGLAWAPLGTAGRSVGAPTRPPRDGLAQNGPPAARLSLPLLAHGTLERYIVAGATAQARTATALARTPRTPAATATRTATPPGSATPVASSSPTPGATLTPVASPTPTAPSPSPAGPSPTPSATATPSITPTASTTPTPSRTPTPRADPAGERLVPWASLREGARTVTFDAAARTYRLAYRGGMTLTFEIDLRHPDNARGRLAVREVTSGRFPMSGAGLYYRQADGTEIEPRLFSLVGAVDEVAHALLPEGDGVELSVRETLENVAHQKRYTVRLVGRALEIRAESLDGGVPPGAGGYAGFTAGDIEGSMDGVSVRLPYMDAVPVTMLDHQWFASTLLDYPRSHADALAARGPTLLPGAFANEIGAFYRPDAAGEVRPVDETVWVTLSPDVTDVFAVPRQPPSPHRPALAGRVHVTLAGGPGAPAFATQAAWLARLQGWGVDDLQVHRDGWIDPRVPAPAQWPPAPAAGGPEGLRSLANTAGGRLSVTLAYTMTDAGCADRPSPLYRAADRVMGRDGMPKQVTAGTCPDGMATGGYLLAPDAAVRLAAAAGDELARAGIGGVDVSEVATWNPAYAWPGAPDNALDRGAPPAHPATVGGGIHAYKRLMAALQAAVGPVSAAGAHGPWEVGYDTFYTGYVDAVSRALSTGSADQPAGAPYLVVPDYELAIVRPGLIGYGMGGYERFFADWPAGQDRQLTEAEIDEWQATGLAYGHAGAWQTRGDGAPGDLLSAADQVKTYYVSRALQARYLDADLVGVGYADATGVERDLSWALANDLDLAGPRLHIRYATLDLWINHSAAVWPVALGGGVHLLPEHGWLARGPDLLAYSALVEGRRADYLDAPEWRVLDGRGRTTQFGSDSARFLVVRLPDGRRLEAQADGSLVWSGP